MDARGRPAARPAEAPAWRGFEFTGTAGEYFRIWIVNTLLTLATLGIYSAWAKVRTEAYFYGNTRLDGSSFRYTAAPLQILGGRVVAVGLLAACWALLEFHPEARPWTLGAAGLLLPFLLVASLSFRLRNSAWRNVRFGFHADYAGAYRAFLVPVALALLAAIGYALYRSGAAAVRAADSGAGAADTAEAVQGFFLVALVVLVPLFDYLRRRFIVTHARFGTLRATFGANAWAVYKPYLVVALLGSTASFAVGAAGTLSTVALDLKVRAAGGSPGDTALLALVTGIFGLLYYGIGLYLAGYLKARLTNLTYNATTLGPLALRSRLEGAEIGWLYLTNSLAIVASAGLLIPWARIRMARYAAGCTALLGDDFSAIRALQEAEPSAVGEAVGEVFGLDLGL